MFQLMVNKSPKFTKLLVFVLLPSKQSTLQCCIGLVYSSSASLSNSNNYSQLAYSSVLSIERLAYEYEVAQALKYVLAINIILSVVFRHLVH